MRTLHAPGGRVAEGVGDRFLHDAEAGDLQLGRQPPVQVQRRLSVPSSSSIATPDSADCASRYARSAGTRPTSSSSGGRRSTDILRTRAIRSSTSATASRRRRRAGAPAARAPELQPQLQRGQRLPQLVVQLVREEAPLVLLGRLEAAVQQPEALVGDAQLRQRVGGRARVRLDVADDGVDHHRQQRREQRR